MVEPCTASALTKNILKNVWFDCLFDGWVESDCLIAGIIWRDTCNAPFFKEGTTMFWEMYGFSYWKLCLKNGPLQSIVVLLWLFSVNVRKAASVSVCGVNE